MTPQLLLVACTSAFSTSQPTSRSLNVQHARSCPPTFQTSLDTAQLAAAASMATSPMQLAGLAISPPLGYRIGAALASPTAPLLVLPSWLRIASACVVGWLLLSIAGDQILIRRPVRALGRLELRLGLLRREMLAAMAVLTQDDADQMRDDGHGAFSFDSVASGELFLEQQVRQGGLSAKQAKSRRAMAAQNTQPVEAVVHA